MMRSSILGASTMLNVLIQHLPLQSLFWTNIWRAFQASDPSNYNLLKLLTAMSEPHRRPPMSVFGRWPPTPRFDVRGLFSLWGPPHVGPTTPSPPFFSLTPPPPLFIYWLNLVGLGWPGPVGSLLGRWIWFRVCAG